MIKDRFNRNHNYLRISLTDNCNLRCHYCMPEEDYTFTPQANLMQPDELEKLATLFVKEGVTKIRLTGGEPLVRKDAASIILKLSRLPVHLTLTTNGTRLHEFVEVLEQANIHSLNISLDTLDAEKFKILTRRDLFQQVVENIELLVKKGFHIKVNTVVMKGFNDQELTNFIAWTKEIPVHVRFIEFMPFAGNQWKSDKVVTWQEILQNVSHEYSFLPLAHEENETAKKYIVPGHAGTFAVISTMSENFCGDCNRMRLTADGKLKNCLFSKEETDLLNALRNGKEIIPLIHQSIMGKAKELGGQFTADFSHLHAEDIQNRSMISIGG
jgi:cyclic pyranopterin phosphate synthase